MSASAPSPQLITTADGSPTLYVAALDEHYHSTRGAEQESLHVYIQAGLVPALATHSPDTPLRVLEIGFGTGLNALLTWEHLAAAETRQAVEYDTLERFPLPSDVVSAYTAALPAGPPERATRFQALHAAPWEEWTPLAAHLRLRKRQADVTTLALPVGAYDLIYYDAFAPTKQPELWTAELLTRVGAALAPGGAVVTYCATGALKRAWRAAGLGVESLPGAPGKREMVRASRPR